MTVTLVRPAGRGTTRFGIATPVRARPRRAWGGARGSRRGGRRSRARRVHPGDDAAPRTALRRLAVHPSPGAVAGRRRSPGALTGTPVGGRFGLHSRIEAGVTS